MKMGFKSQLVSEAMTVPCTGKHALLPPVYHSNLSRVQRSVAGIGFVSYRQQGGIGGLDVFLIFPIPKAGRLCQ